MADLPNELVKREFHYRRVRGYSWLIVSILLTVWTVIDLTILLDKHPGLALGAYNPSVERRFEWATTWVPYPTSYPMTIRLTIR